MITENGMYTVWDLVKITALISVVMFLTLFLLRLVLGAPAEETTKESEDAVEVLEVSEKKAELR